jgi:hypothetical protein
MKLSGSLQSIQQTKKLPRKLMPRGEMEQQPPAGTLKAGWPDAFKY